MQNRFDGYQSYLLALLWLAGMMKDFLNTFIIQLDWTGLLIGVVTVDIFLNIISKRISLKKKHLNIFLALILFYLWIVISLAYSPSLDYKYEKTLKFIGNLVFFIYPLTIKEIDFNKVLRTYFLILLPIATYYVYNLSFGSLGGRLIFDEELRGNYLQVAMHLGLLILMLEFFKYRKWLKYLCILLILATSARGPVIFLILTLVIYWGTNFKFSQVKLKSVFNASILFTACIALFLYFKSTFLNLMVVSKTRFLSLIGGDDNSLMTRLGMYDFGFFQPFEKFTTIFFGNGIGSFGLLFFGEDGRAYPHNFFLEVFFELGVIGLVIISILLLPILKSLSINKNIFSLLFLFLFFNAMKSSSLTDLWLFFGVMVGVFAFRNAENKIFIRE